MNRSFGQLLQVHFKTFFREPAILFWAVGFPILMAWVLGVAFSSKSETLRTVYIVGENNEKLKEEILTGEETGNSFRIRFKKTTEQEAVTALKKGIIALYIESKNDSVIYHFDPSNPDAQLTHLMLEREFTNAKSGKSSITPLTSQGTRYIDFLIPGLMALGIMNSCLWGISWSLIEIRMKKLLRRMVATPMKKTYFLGSHIVTRLALSSIESGLLFLFAFLYFGTTISGSVTALLLVFIASIFAFSGIGILAAARTSNSQIGNGIINAITIPMTILSGIFFNYHNFPEWTIPLIQSLPLTMVADSIRAVFIEAAGIKDVLVPVIILSTTGLVTFVIGLRIFRWY